MCKCTNTTGFALAMQNAVEVEKKTGIKQAIFTKNEQTYFGKLAAVKKMTDICCYYLTSGEEIEIKKPDEKVEEKVETKPDSTKDKVETKK